MTWQACEAILAEPMARGYRFWPVPNTVGADEPYAILIYDRAGTQLDTAEGRTYKAAAEAALGIVARDVARREAA